MRATIIGLTVVLFASGAIALVGCSKPYQRTTAASARIGGAPTAGKAASSEEAAIGRAYNAGYTHITGMTEDAKGGWHGSARKDGKTTAVHVDSRGSVTGG